MYTRGVHDPVTKVKLSNVNETQKKRIWRKFQIMAAKSLAKLFSYGGRLTPTGLRRSIRLGGAVALNDAFVKDNQFLGSSLDGSLLLHGHGQPFHTSNSHSKRQTAKVFQRMMASENRTIEIW